MFRVICERLEHERQEIHDESPERRACEHGGDEIRLQAASRLQRPDPRRRTALACEHNYTAKFFHRPFGTKRKAGFCCGQKGDLGRGRVLFGTLTLPERIRCRSASLRVGRRAGTPSPSEAVVRGVPHELLVSVRTVASSCHLQLLFLRFSLPIRFHTLDRSSTGHSFGHFRRRLDTSKAPCETSVQHLRRSKHSPCPHPPRRHHRHPSRPSRLRLDP